MTNSIDIARTITNQPDGHSFPVSRSEVLQLAKDFKEAVEFVRFWRKQATDGTPFAKSCDTFLDLIGGDE